MGAVVKRCTVYRDARGRFIARPMLCIGTHRIGVHTPARTAPRPPRAFAFLVRILVAMFSLEALARSWGKPS
jgi:hypothetical protein